MAGAEEFSGWRREMLGYIKRGGEAGVQAVADFCGMTHEGARRQLLILEKEGWISRRTQRAGAPAVGRPLLAFSLTEAGEHLFPKHYDHLAATVLGTLAETAGPESLRGLLAALAEKQVRSWEPKLKGKSLRERLELLKDLYWKDDPFVTVEGEGPRYRLVERNCPYLNVAMAFPAICSLSVCTLQRLLGVKVVREEKFQNGDRRCAFVILADQPAKEQGFRFEGDAAPPGAVGSAVAAPSGP